MSLRVNVARISGPFACPLMPDDHSDVLLLCLTGQALDRPFMQRWTRNLDSRYGSFWKDATVYDCRALRLLLLGYILLCAPCSLAVAYLAGWHLAYSLIVSLGLILLLWRSLLAHHYFSKVENQFAFNVNTQMASFFKQYPAYPMKPYGKLVPHVTVSRMFVDNLKVTFTTLCYHTPRDTSLLIPTACEAIDTLRGKKNTSFYINLIVVSGDSIESMQALHAFFTASGFRATLAIDCSLLVCAWGRRHGCTISMQSLAEVEDIDYHLLPITFTVDAAKGDVAVEPPPQPQPPHCMSPLVCRPHYSRSMRSSMIMHRPSKKSVLLAWLQRLFPDRRHCYYHRFDNNQLVFMS